MTRLDVEISHVEVNESPLGENFMEKKGIDDCSSQYRRGCLITSLIVLDCSFQVGCD